MTVPIEARGWLTRHEQRCWRNQEPAVITFDYFNGERVIRSESYMIDAEGHSHLLPTVHNGTGWRYMITVFEPSEPATPPR